VNPIRTIGVEEELLLVDAATCLLRPVAQHVVAACSAAEEGRLGRPEVKHEFFLEQVEIATSPCSTTHELAIQLRDGRRRVAQTAAPYGVVPVAVPLPILGRRQATPTPGERYERIREAYGQVASDSLFCALQVHVQVYSDDEAIGVVDRMRPWVPLLLALSANSPWWCGTDTGYASWRAQLWARWPSSGPREPFGDMASYRATAASLIRSGAALDKALLNFDLRPSERYPTVELRVADVCTDVSDAVALAALVRALVSTTAEQWSRGVPTPDWTVEHLRTARETASRGGLDGLLVNPVTGDLDSVADVLATANEFASKALLASGDTDVLRSATKRWLLGGNGATRQRAVHATAGSLDSIVRDVVARTLAG